MPKTAAHSSQWGGARPGAGRKRQTLPATEQFTPGELGTLHDLCTAGLFAAQHQALADKIRRMMQQTSPPADQPEPPPG